VQSDPFTTPQLFDTFIVFTSRGRVIFPGTSTISIMGGINEATEDTLGGNATTTVLNYQPHEVVVRNRIWTSQQYQKLSAVVQLMRPLKGLKTEELECLHPQLEQRGILRLFLHDIETTEYVTGEPYTTIFRLKEWWPEVTEKNNTQKIGKGAEGVGAVDGYNPSDYDLRQFRDNPNPNPRTITIEITRASLAEDEEE
jgi:hypothetical protein